MVFIMIRFVILFLHAWVILTLKSRCVSLRAEFNAFFFIVFRIYYQEIYLFFLMFFHFCQIVNFYAIREKFYGETNRTQDRQI